ncbi:putative hetero-Diels-Alderase [Pseudocercospora fuligena]|uniref:Putative hetero-Diels-Alderase n=1 Tax=Pseudocercospora fuligena TaxID=685502 RepID=A0A8H6RCB3_9PEZI|nr:putative hetero-Diels-Alderase [Pseudocercospora fuligena]
MMLIKLATWTGILSFSPGVLSAPSAIHHSVPSGHVRNDAVKLLYQYPKGIWIENIAVRETGDLLLTILSLPHLDQLNPFEPNPKPHTLFSFPDAGSVAGIAEIDYDTFAMAVGNFSLKSGPVNGSWSIWKSSFAEKKYPPNFAKMTDLPEAIFPNGMCGLPGTPTPHAILNGDIRTGKVWRINTTTGAHEVIIDNNLTAVVTDPVFGESGVNGIHVTNESLYFVNTGQQILARMPIKPDGTPIRPPEIIARINAPFEFDDFAIQGDVGYFVTGSGNSIASIRLDGHSRAKIIAGQLNSTEIAEPTSAAFGRTRHDKHILYVVTAGGLAAPVNGNITIGAQVLAIDMKKLGLM